MKLHRYPLLLFSDLIMSMAILVAALSTAAIPWVSSALLIGIIFSFQGAVDGTVNTGKFK